MSISFSIENPRIYNMDASEEALPRKPIFLHAALMATQGLQDEQSRAMKEYHPS
jgi:hypothetical protein